MYTDIFNTPAKTSHRLIKKLRDRRRSYSMKVIFQQDVRGQGKKGEMKEVSEGYGRNYLLPRGLAVEANKDNLNTLALKEKARAAGREKEARAAAKSTGKNLTRICRTCKMIRR